MLYFTALVLCGTAVAGTDKTLVSWVALANTTQQGGSALTIQDGDRDGEDLTLRIFIDKNLVEVFANDRQAAVAATASYERENLGIRLFSKGADSTVKQVLSWKMKSIYPTANPTNDDPAKGHPVKR